MTHLPEAGADGTALFGRQITNLRYEEEGDLNSITGKRFDHVVNFRFFRSWLTDNSEINLGEYLHGSQY